MNTRDRMRCGAPFLPSLGAESPARPLLACWGRATGSPARPLLACRGGIATHLGPSIFTCPSAVKPLQSPSALKTETEFEAGMSPGPVVACWGGELRPGPPVLDHQPFKVVVERRRGARTCYLLRRRYMDKRVPLSIRKISEHTTFINPFEIRCWPATSGCGKLMLRDFLTKHSDSLGPWRTRMQKYA